MKYKCIWNKGLKDAFFLAELYQGVWIPVAHRGGIDTLEKAREFKTKYLSELGTWQEV